MGGERPGTNFLGSSPWRPVPLREVSAPLGGVSPRPYLSPRSYLIPFPPLLGPGCSIIPSLVSLICSHFC